jgi:hypothetical protein
VALKQAYYDVRREYEVFKSNAERATETQSAVSNELYLHHVDEINSFENQIKDMQAAIGNVPRKVDCCEEGMWCLTDMVFCPQTHCLTRTVLGYLNGKGTSFKSKFITLPLS